VYRCPSCGADTVAVDHRVVGKTPTGRRLVEECLRCTTCGRTDCARKDLVAYNKMIDDWHRPRPPRPPPPPTKSDDG